MAVRPHPNIGNRGAKSASSDRAFGAVFAAFFLILAISPLRTGGGVRLLPLLLAVLFALLAGLRPAALRPLNRAWSRLGFALGRIFTPVAATLLFLVVFVPAGLLWRMVRHDPLKVGWRPELDSYWIAKNAADAVPERMRRQF